MVTMDCANCNQPTSVSEDRNVILRRLKQRPLCRECRRYVENPGAARGRKITAISAIEGLCAATVVRGGRTENESLAKCRLRLLATTTYDAGGEVDEETNM